MAYINQDTKKQIAQALKTAFPKSRFSLSVQNHSSLTVKVLKDDVLEAHHGLANSYSVYGEEHNETIDLTDREFYAARANNLDDHPALVEHIEKIGSVIRQAGQWFDKSDSMTDYFHTAFYFRVVAQLKDVHPIEKQAA